MLKNMLILIFNYANKFYELTALLELIHSWYTVLLE